jgi:RNA polymerase sigma-70 factor (ECF subfamily)
MRALAVLVMTASADGPGDCSDAIQAARAGDLAAFESIMRRYERLVLSVALRLTGNLEDAQDVSQEVFLKLHKNLHKVEASSNFSGWLYRVTVNVCHDLRKKRPADLALEDAGEVAAAGTDPQQSAAEWERRRVLALSLRMLSAKERAALVLRDLEGLSTEEVARALGSSEATVRSQVSKARVKVKDFVERYFRRRA